MGHRRRWERRASVANSPADDPGTQTRPRLVPWVLQIVAWGLAMVLFAALTAWSAGLLTRNQLAGMGGAVEGRLALLFAALAGVCALSATVLLLLSIFWSGRKQDARATRAGRMSFAAALGTIGFAALSAWFWTTGPHQAVPDLPWLLDSNSPRGQAAIPIVSGLLAVVCGAVAAGNAVLLGFEVRMRRAARARRTSSDGSAAKRNGTARCPGARGRSGRRRSG